MKLSVIPCVLLYLLVSCRAWPRYGRPHPLYSGRMQSNNDILASAFLLGLDYNELQTLQAAGGEGFGLGNIGLPNRGFPMNARELKRARQDVNTLTVLGVIDNPEEGGPFGALVTPNAADPPDNRAAGARTGTEKAGKKVKVKGARNGKKKGKITKNTRKTGASTTENVKAESAKRAQTNKALKDVSTTTQSGTVREQSVKHNAKSSNKRANVPKKKAIKRKKKRPQNRGMESDRAENAQTSGSGKPSKQRNRNRGMRGRRKLGGTVDHGEGHLAEQGAGDLRDRPIPFGRTGGRVTVWRTGGEDGQTGGGDVLDRFLITGR